jgi:diaminopimelate epimerase
MIPAVHFEKWQALGNDYLILEAARLPFALTPDTIRRLCDPHRGPGGDGVLELSPPSEAGSVARLRIFNPDGSEAELSGNGARQAVLYLRRSGWTDSDVFSIETPAGEIRPTITGETTARVDMGAATLRSKDYPDGPEDGTGDLRAGGRTWRFQHVSIGNPQCAVHVEDRDELEALDLQALGPEFERSPLFPNRTNTSFWTALGAAAIRARIYERGAGETLSSGTGACGAAVAHVVRGGESPVTVHLDGGELRVGVGEGLRVDLTGWAVPVYRGELSAELLAELGYRDGDG